MSRRIYYEDAYKSKFMAKVLTHKDTELILDQTAFYPGGGGQDSDNGKINGFKVEKIYEQNGKIVHVVPEIPVREGKTVHGEINWNRRHDLMRGHTAEHLIASQLGSLVPGVEIVKANISPIKKSLFISRELNWNILRKVQIHVNKAIMKGANVETKQISETDAKRIDGLRIKWDKIPGGLVRIVEIEGIDKAACTGLHVKNIKEIDQVLIKRFAKGQAKTSYEIEFLISNDAKLESLKISSFSLETCNFLGCSFTDMKSRVASMKKELNDTKKYLREMSKEFLQSLKSEKLSGFNFYKSTFSGINRKELVNTANDLTTGNRNIVLFINITKGLSVILGCNEEIDLDCIEVLNKCLKKFDGNCGGRKNIAIGGMRKVDLCGQLIKQIEKEIETRLKR